MESKAIDRATAGRLNEILEKTERKGEKMNKVLPCPFCNGEHPEYVSECSNCGGIGEIKMENENIKDRWNKTIERLGNFTFWIANNASALLRLSLDATVEAEFGSDVVSGKYTTLAHHGSRAGNKPPCDPRDETDVAIFSVIFPAVGISHVDLDCLGGILRLAGYYPGKHTAEYYFWRLAAEIDKRGYHCLPDIRSELLTEESIQQMHLNSEPIELAIRMYHAWCAYSAQHRYFPPRHDDAVDCSGKIIEFI